MLKLCREFFSYLDKEQIRYCHWKSNEHLIEAVSGKTDLDVLVHADDQMKLESAITQFEIKKIMSPPSKQYPGLEDYLGFDTETGKFIHLHVHYRMVMGQKYIKNHWLPLEELFFANLIEKDGIKIPRPELELILLYIRGHVKADYSSIIKHGIKGFYDNSYTAFPQDIESEFRHLIATSDMDVVAGLLQESGLPLSIDRLIRFCNRLKNKELKFHQVLSEQIFLLRALSGYRRAKSWLIYFSYFAYFLQTFSVVQKFKKPQKKTLPQSGISVALIGADGSGKSTLSADLKKWLSWKMRVDLLYYGIPKTKTVAFFSFVARGLAKFKLDSFLAMQESLFWLYVARQREKVSQQSGLTKLHGGIALMDRFPMKQFREMPEPMDGPRLINRKEGIHSLFSDRERVVYESLRVPDIIIVLQVDYDVLKNRKKDLPPENEHRIKADAINRLSEQNDGVVVIDANQPYEAVLLSAKRIIWNAI